MSEPQVLLMGVGIGESPRWHGGRLWFADWGAREIVAVDTAGTRETVAEGPGVTFCLDFLPDGRLVVVDGAESRLLRREADGTFVTHADLSTLAGAGWNDVVVDRRGGTYVNNVGFDLMAGEPPTPGWVAFAGPDGPPRKVADGLAFPNGMALTPEGSTLVVAESYAGRLTAYDVAPNGGLAHPRVWAAVEGSAPDGICVDAEGAVWYGDVPNRRCVRVREGGEVLQTVQLDRGCFACALGGADGRTLFMVAAVWRGPAQMFDPPRTGQVLTVRVPVGAPD